MKTFVVTILDDVCIKNNRDPEGTALIEAARNFGKVESWDSAVSSLRNNYQGIIDNLKKQIETIEENGVTAEELEVLRVLRKKAAVEGAAFQEAIRTRDEQLRAIQVENENRANQIKAIFGI